MARRQLGPVLDGLAFGQQGRCEGFLRLVPRWLQELVPFKRLQLGQRALREGDKLRAEPLRECEQQALQESGVVH